ncbi:MAG: hypothetical protein H7835_14115 [Magnetococcus sp. XQGC-1]
MVLAWSACSGGWGDYQRHRFPNVVALPVGGGVIVTDDMSSCPLGRMVPCRVRVVASTCWPIAPPGHRGRRLSWSSIPGWPGLLGASDLHLLPSPPSACRQW